jgi:hypothetical protein
MQKSEKDFKYLSPYLSIVQTIKLFFKVALIIANLFAYHTLVWAQESDLPQAPDTGTPENNSSPGGTRIDKNSTCKKTQKTLTSLLGIGDFTLSKYPTFWFYIPYSSQEISYLEFTLKDTAELRTIYRTSIELTDKPGIIHISIPNEDRYGLELQTNHNWELKVYCVSKQKNQPDIILNGSIRRIPINLQLENQLKNTKEEYSVYMNNYIYYDAVTNLAAFYLANSNDIKLTNTWNNLLELLGKKELIGESLVKVTSLSLPK